MWREIENRVCSLSGRGGVERVIGYNLIDYDSILIAIGVTKKFRFVEF